MCLGQSETPGWDPTLTRVNIIPPGDAKQEVYIARQPKPPGNQENSLTSESRRNSLPSSTFPVHFLARYCFASVTEISPRNTRSRGTHSRSYICSWLKEAVPASGGVAGALGWSLGRCGLSKSRPRAERSPTRRARGQ